jgi:clan AA aspartic protease (TIGR02281 family)
MICKKCGTDNPEHSVYCESCGHPLIRGPIKKKKIPPLPVLAVVLFALLVMGYFGVKIISRTPRKDITTISKTSTSTTTQNAPKKIKAQSPALGRIVVEDASSAEISGCPSSLIQDKWIAMPVWALLDGKNVVFQNEAWEDIPITEGIWAMGDPLVLLKLQNDPAGNSPGLFPWIRYKPLAWRSLIENGSLFQVQLDSPEKKGFYLSVPLPGEIQEPGVFMQDGHVVGWSYPDHLNRGYLWAGPAGADLSPNIQMDRFLNTVIPQWRETHFHSVLRRGEGLHAVRRLEDFAQGILMESPFSEEDIPDDLRLESIVFRMHDLSSQLISNGFAEDVARILNEDIIIRSQGLPLMKDSVLAKVESQDYNKAIQFLTRVKKNIFEKTGQGAAGLNEFHAQLYKDWLRKILDRGGYYSGMAAFEEAKRLFPGDVELHLLGVEVALSEKNWSRARELLQMRDYPESMRAWVGELENEIQETQQNEGAVTVRFTPGTSHIPVRVYLNGTRSLRFILDTGATMCSIPSSAVDRLGINIDQSTPVRLISTAGGYAETHEVELKSVELEGFRVSNVKALIIDIPGYRDHGLLGQNFLNNFHIEIDNHKGILRLKKR